MTHAIKSTHRADVIEILRDERADLVETVAPTFNNWGVLVEHGKYCVLCPLRSSRTDTPVMHAVGRTPDEAVAELRASWGDEYRFAPWIFDDSVYGVPV